MRRTPIAVLMALLVLGLTAAVAVASSVHLKGGPRA